MISVRFIGPATRIFVYSHPQQLKRIWGSFLRLTVRHALACILVYENLELTVPEPSLFEISDDENRPATSTQLNSAEKSVKFNLTEPRKSRKSEPIMHSQTMPVRNPYYHDNYYMAPPQVGLLASSLDKNLNRKKYP